MEVGFLLQSGFILTHQKLRLLARDLLWKFLYVVSTWIWILAVTLWLLNDLRGFQWQGPELTPGNPILLVMALGTFWSHYSGTLAWAGASVVLGALVLWIVFEALFRGGTVHFWRYAGTRLGSIAVMGSATMILAAMTVRANQSASEAAGWIGILSAFVLLVLWWMITMSETLVRREAVRLLVTDLPRVLGASGTLLGLHLLLSAAALSTGSFSVKMMVHATGPVQFIAAAFLMMAALMIWTIIHSYLIVVRYSTIDIMRNNVVEP